MRFFFWSIVKSLKLNYLNLDTCLHTLLAFDTKMLFFRMLSGHVNPCLKALHHVLLFLFLLPKFPMKLNRFPVSALRISPRLAGSLLHFQRPLKGLWVDVNPILHNFSAMQIKLRWEDYGKRQQDEGGSQVNFLPHHSKDPEAIYDVIWSLGMGTSLKMQPLLMIMSKELIQLHHDPVW